MEMKEHAGKIPGYMTCDEGLKADSEVETKKKVEPKNKARQPKNKTREETV